MDTKLYNSIKKEIYENEKHPLAVQKLLVLKGMSEEDAINAVSEVRTQERNKLISNANINMILGIILIIAGIIGIILINSKQDLKVKDFIIQFKRRYSDKSKMNFKVLLILIKFYLSSLFKKMRFF